jgi:hypothetical protein
MLERLERDARGDIELGDRKLKPDVHDFICTTLRRTWDEESDEDTSPNLPILPKECLILPQKAAPPLRGDPPHSYVPPNLPSPPNLPAKKLWYFGGWDGASAFGLMGHYLDGWLERNNEFLERCKKLAIESPNGEFHARWHGHNIIVYARGAREGLLYQYRISFEGVTILIHHNPPKKRQPIRITFGAEGLMVNHAKAVWGRVCEFIRAIGFVITEAIPSRADWHITFDGVTMAELKWLWDNDYFVSKLRKGGFLGTGNGSKFKPETLLFGKHDSDVQVEIYDKEEQAFGSGSDFGTIKQMLLAEKMGDEKINGNRAMIRVEIRLKRAAFKAMGIDTVDDLFGNEWACINLVLTDWLRILKDPKIKGKEYKQEIHPIFAEIRRLFRLCFPGGDDDAIAEWKTPAPVSCDPVALEKQAMGCLKKSLALRHGSQNTSRDSVNLVTRLAERYCDELHRGINEIALTTEIKTGSPPGKRIEQDVADVKPDMMEQGNRAWNNYRKSLERPLVGFDGQPVQTMVGFYGERSSRYGVDSGLDDPRHTLADEFLARKRQEWRDHFDKVSQERSVQQFYDPPGDSAEERFQ